VRRRPSVFSRILSVIAGRSDAQQMSQPYGIAVGPDRKIYVVDTVGGTIHVYDLERPGYDTIKVNGHSLIGIGFAAGRMFVTDSASGRLLCLNAKGRVEWTLGPKDGLSRPTGIATIGERLYVVDTMMHHIAVVSVGGTLLGTFGRRGDGPGEFNYPTNIARGADDRLYVTDTMNFRVQMFDAGGQYLGAFGHVGDATGDFDKPKGVAVDSGGHVYVVEGLRDVVQVFDASGRLLLIFGGSGFGDGQLWLPSGIAISNDIVYVADSANRRVQMFEYLKESSQ
jgi:sugar lactone lactonase YvrE